jgi:hypothetical protein
MWCEKLKREIVVPEGWFAVPAGVARMGDQAWSEPAGFGPVAIYNLGNDVEGFWCVIRKYVDEGAGI